MAEDQSRKRRARLGRGLTSLITAPPPSNVGRDPDHTADDAVSHSADARHTIRIGVNQVEPNPFQPRRRFDDDALAQLADSIRRDGLLQPLVVRPKSGQPDRFELVAGERRWRAAKLAGLDSVPVMVRELSDEETAELALIENIQREDLNPIERAEAFQRLIDHHGLSHERVADRVCIDRSTVTNALRLLALHADVQQLVRDNLLSAGQARAIAALSDAEAQRALAVKAVKQAMSVRQVETAVRASGSSSGRGAARKSRATHLADLEKQISQQLGTKVRVQQGRKKGAGTLSIEFYSLEQFDDLLSRLGVKTE